MKTVLPLSLFFFFYCLAFPCICYGIHCKTGMYDTSGNAAIVISECAADEHFCSAIGCAIGTEQITVLWSCEKQNNTEVLVKRVSFENHTCMARIGHKDANMSNEEFAFPELVQLVLNDLST
ncbi:hypothetical protein niasHS_008090 [Heterodera schachtii]|uniref:Uncharacterized protein n=1 Tax=Heterodera schachtii TaxID=97005 RepID=A0ABD2J7J3_HETSC